MCIWGVCYEFMVVDIFFYELMEVMEVLLLLFCGNESLN